MKALCTLPSIVSGKLGSIKIFVLIFRKDVVRNSCDKKLIGLLLREGVDEIKFHDREIN